MIPSAWPGIVLALAVFRTVRFLGWDDFSPIQRARDWATGAYETTSGSFNARNGLTDEPVATKTAHRRPTLSKLLWCPWCLSPYVGAAWYVAWRLWPSPTLTAGYVVAVSAAVGLIAKNWDP